ncbi:MAG TPA: hypothetical protein VJW51_06120 [Candidatus Acidoferrales bacterium]|nr:hypothetical protein [Candidatus Acidoferrales bacterium]
MKLVTWICFLCLALPTAAMAQEQHHEHPAPEKLGKVSFPTSCRQEVQATFDRGVALLHSFAYSAADETFAAVSASDPQCAMAHWGRAMSRFQQLWEPALPGTSLERGSEEVKKAQQIGTESEEEREYVAALALIFQPGDSLPYPARAHRYEEAMGALAAHYPGDAEAQIFYALALLATASPDDTTHGNQKKAVEILEPLHDRLPEHPGIVHYLIHACDNSEMAARGLPAARAYAHIAPSAPHALHMPSHIFTRLGMWEESIQSNLAARAAAHEQGDTGEELHAMDYLVYAYLQKGRSGDAAGVLQQLRAMETFSQEQFKAGYAATAMPVRYAIERRQWAEAADCRSGAGAPPHVAAIAAWARAVGLARAGKPAAAKAEVQTLRQLEEELRTSARSYWASQVHIQVLEASAWMAHANGKAAEAEAFLRDAAEREDSLEKLPVTPGPIVPAREQLGDLLLESGRPEQALVEFESSLLLSPGRRGALEGALQAAELAKDETKARKYRVALQKDR